MAQVSASYADTGPSIVASTIELSSVVGLIGRPPGVLVTVYAFNDVGVVPLGPAEAIPQM